MILGALVIRSIDDNENHLHSVSRNSSGLIWKMDDRPEAKNDSLLEDIQ